MDAIIWKKLLKTSKRKLLNRYFPDVTGAVPGWGRKASAKRAHAIASLTFRKAVQLEDGFLRSRERDDTPLSLVLDERGIYYDAAKPSDLEHLIVQELTSKQLARADRIRELWCENSVSKYNHLPEPDSLPEGEYVLLMDQVKGDQSIRCGLASDKDFMRMLADARKENPIHKIIIKTHPDVSSGNKEGHFDLEEVAKMDRVEIYADATHPVSLINGAKRVYTVTSQTGFEALLHGVPVTCYGYPFYAGYGLTEDRADLAGPHLLNARNRRKAASLAQLTYAALCLYPRYLDPSTSTPITVEQAIMLVGKHRSRLRIRNGDIHAIGFSLWKKPILRRFLAPARVTFHDSMRTIPLDATVALWGAHGTEHLHPDCKILRIEDGFIRSKGLGAALVPPSSWIADDLGIYFDSTTPSRLEMLLQHGTIPVESLAEAKELHKRILDARITKYNLPASRAWKRPAKERHVILVPGQVETDASIKLGSPKIKTNLDLVKAVRLRNPEAYIIYKPHPDVQNGYRSHGQTEEKIPQFCDEILNHGDITQLLDEVDEVHTMTSLTGFEGLLRNVDVTCYGQPFYSGWGLTTDIHPCARRTRMRTLEELISAALIQYPDYMSRREGKPISPMAAIAEIKSYKPGLISYLPGHRVMVKWAALRGEKKREKNDQ